ncbi:MAG: 16S rRNA (cytosine(967)-C(5))-methyltransferase RsmB [Lachnospiraceae bacterium]|nr:16S rRNA (cytosine(967)-C(5))-methyltransferase RsmB [Lachnospiraceae bacterium]
MNGREAVLDILLELAGQTEYSNVLIAAVLDKFDYLDSREKAFIKRVSEGCIERRIQIDHVLDQYSKTPVIKMKPLIRELLRMSVYQLLFMEHIPDAAVCNEAVKLAKKRGFKSLQGYVNGVLRNIARGRGEIVYPDREKEPDAWLSVRYSMPLWLVVHFRETYGTDACEKILAASLERQPVSLRLKEGISAEERSRLFAAWEAAGVTVRQHPYHPCAVTVQGAAGIRKLAGYDEGLFAVQDVSSILAVEAAGISPGDTVIDVCAAPGGKALFAAQKLEKSGEVIACDVSDFKTDKIEENRRRLGVENVSVLVQDARSRNESLVGRADVLMADVPCSGLGVIGHKQDIKYRVTRESLEEILVLQKDIITNVIDYIKPGGTLLYSTCTLNPGENEEMVEWICQNFGLERVSMAGQLPDALKVEAESGMLQLLPGIHETDGFFMAKLLKKE